jgi:hypothetical protein
MLIAAIIFVVGMFLIVSNPIIGLIPGLFLIVISIIWFVFAVFFKGIGAVAGIGSTKQCPECRSQIPSDATVCRHCNYRYG